MKAGGDLSTPTPPPDPEFFLRSASLSTCRSLASAGDLLVCLETLPRCHRFILKGSAPPPWWPRDGRGSEGLDWAIHCCLMECATNPPEQNRLGKSQERGCVFRHALFGIAFAEQTWSSLAPVSDSENEDMVPRPHRPGQAVSPLGLEPSRYRERPATSPSVAVSGTKRRQ